jgi:hypothetical protein
MPPKETTCSPPLTVVPMARPPEETVSRPPTICASLLTPPDRTNSKPLVATWAPTGHVLQSACVRHPA